MNIFDIIDQTIEIPTETKYWFVRTDYGKYFDTFYENGFIAIGWNNIEVYELNELSAHRFTIQQKLIHSELIDSDTKMGKSKITSIINKLSKFVELKENDVVIIPDQNSGRYAFGTIIGDETYTETEETLGCDHQKRRKVQWHAQRTMQQLDPIFYKMRFTQHSISSIQEYAPYIDAVIHPLFRKDDNTHLVLDILKKTDINVEVLVQLMKNIQGLAMALNEEYNFGEQVDQSTIKINLQSPGKVEFIYPIGKSIILAALLIGMVACNFNRPDNDIENEINLIRDRNRAQLNIISDSLDFLEAKCPEID